MFAGEEKLRILLFLVVEIPASHFSAVNGRPLFSQAFSFCFFFFLVFPGGRNELFLSSFDIHRTSSVRLQSVRTYVNIWRLSVLPSVSFLTFLSPSVLTFQFPVLPSVSFSFSVRPSVNFSRFLSARKILVFCSTVLKFLTFSVRPFVKFSCFLFFCP